jgi:hypothetical protein
MMGRRFARGWIAASAIAVLLAWSGAARAVRVRFRLGTDSSVGRAGWSVDDVLVQGCRPHVPDGNLPYRRIFPLAYRK